MPSSNSGLASTQAQEAGTDTPEVATVDRKQRKRLQNRLNQRARRVRINDHDTTASRRQPRPYRTDRWRLDEREHSHSTAITLRGKTTGAGHGKENNIGSTSNSSFSLVMPVSDKTLSAAEVELYGQQLWAISVSVGAGPSSPTSSPHADHLLHLINYNAFRGIFKNKSMLSVLTKHLRQTSSQLEVVSIMTSFPGQTTIVQSAPGVPPCLTPTRLQMEKEHATWIDLLPFPKFRDNLIKEHDHFDHWMFMRDVIGNLIDEFMFLKPKGGAKPRGFRHLVQSDGLDDGLAANRKGLILWGEPHKSESWEATPGFLRNWGWAVEGCDELVEFSNRWRLVRGEEPMRLVREVLFLPFKDVLTDSA